MQRLRQRFGGLYWRLTSSYFLVTLVAALIVEIAITLPSTIQDFQQQGDTVRFAQFLENREAPLLAPYLSPGSLDADSLQNLLTADITLDIRTNAIKAQPVLYFGVVANNQRVVAASPNCLQGQILDGASINVCTGQQIPNDKFLAPIGAALAGRAQAADWIAITPANTLIAVPIHGSGDNHVIGALIAVIVGPSNVNSVPVTPTFLRFLAIFWSHLQSDGIYFILLASVIGTLTGLLIMRNVTWRLRHIAQAAESWSKGDFEAAVRDPARDEIGQLAQDLNGMAAQIQTLLTTRAALAVVEERNRLARDLHDSVKQHIFANALLINAARNLLAQHPEQASMHLEEAEHLAQLAQDELATLIRALRPAALADKGLAAVLRDYTDEWSARMGIAVSLHIAGERPTPLASEEILLRVTQEALTNVARHSGASHVTIALAWQADAISVTLSDDGHGFHVQHTPPGVGLKSMHERVAAAQGHFAITSSAAGTTIQAMIPLMAVPIMTEAGT